MTFGEGTAEDACANLRFGKWNPDHMLGIRLAFYKIEDGSSMTTSPRPSGNVRQKCMRRPGIEPGPPAGNSAGVLQGLKTAVL
jgi:hypothetical protein